MTLNAIIFVVFLCQYIHSFVLPEISGREGYSPPSHPLNLPMRVTSQEFGLKA